MPQWAAPHWGAVDKWKEINDGRYRVQKAAVSALKKLRAVEALISLVSRVKYDAIGAQTAEALGELGDARAIEPLIATLAYATKEWPSFSSRRCAAVRALEALDGIHQIVAALRPRNRPTLRRGAAWALGQLADRRSLDALMAALADRDIHTRCWAAFALGHLADTQAVKPLVACLGDHSVAIPPSDEIGFAISTVADTAWEALERIGGPEAERALAEYRARQK